MYFGQAWLEKFWRDIGDILKATPVTAKNVQRMRSKLRRSAVPVEIPNELSVLTNQEIADRINSMLQHSEYFPANNHGYLGHPKKDGCTRFVPVLTAIDTILYYSLVWQLEEKIIIPTEGVFGAWHTKPEKVTKLEAAANGGHDLYSSNTFNRFEWFKQWAGFNDLLHELSRSTKIGNFVLTSDIANFYDTIDIAHLSEQLYAKCGDERDVVSLLRLFLQLWDRRVKGYTPSSKGIPQEMISDASRTLANFYLHEFDAEFKLLCDAADVTYVRWADDIVLFGKSKRSLEETLHKGSRLLLSIGLNFNASKTRHFTRVQFRKYRAISLLRNLSSASPKKLEQDLRGFLKDEQSIGGRKDTVYRALISKLFNSKTHRTVFLINFLNECTKEYYISGNLDERQIFRLTIIDNNPAEKLLEIANLYARYPYASSKAAFLESLRKNYKKYLAAGISKKRLDGAADKIVTSAADSDIVSAYCYPAYKSVAA